MCEQCTPLIAKPVLTKWQELTVWRSVGGSHTCIDQKPQRFGFLKHSQVFVLEVSTHMHSQNCAHVTQETSFCFPWIIFIQPPPGASADSPSCILSQTMALCCLISLDNSFPFHWAYLQHTHTPLFSFICSLADSPKKKKDLPQTMSPGCCLSWEDHLKKKTNLNWNKNGKEEMPQGTSPLVRNNGWNWIENRLEEFGTILINLLTYLLNKQTNKKNKWATRAEDQETVKNGEAWEKKSVLTFRQSKRWRAKVKSESAEGKSVTAWS